MAMDLSSLIQAIPAIQYGMRGYPTGRTSGISNQLENIAGAQMDPSNPLYQKLYGQYKQQGQQALAGGINELAGQNRKLAAMGRVPLLDQERGGEQMWRGLMQGYQQNQNDAGTQAQNSLMGAARTLGGFGGASGVANQLATMQNKSSQMQAGIGYGNIGNVLKGLFGL